MFVRLPWDHPGPGNGWGGLTQWPEDSCMSGMLLGGAVAAASLILLYQEEQQCCRSETTAKSVCLPTDPCLGVEGGSRKSFYWDLVLINTELSLATLDYGLCPKGSSMDRDRPLDLTTLPSPSLLQSSE